ncbi:hypothetical protein CRE_24515 [Caenorhabditis remanei]|uniref:Uncharacterized protein n=1 Tax=Caenorhabditis remanei TaxID=31234 RepID=E3MG11_CAERE|nr:hypothetical protein CRE_24515 [Caenorhabditis remanei]
MADVAAPDDSRDHSSDESEIRLWAERVHAAILHGAGAERPLCGRESQALCPDTTPSVQGKNGENDVESGEEIGGAPIRFAIICKKEKEKKYDDGN